MFDEVWVYSRLDSPLFGALMQAVELMGPTIHADAAAARVFGADLTAATYVSAARLRAPRHAELALRDWPTQDDSVFGFVEGRGLSDGVFRPRELIDERACGQQSLYRPFDAVQAVTDAIGMSFRMGDEAWCTMVFLRCGESPPFQDAQLDVVERFKPALARVVCRGYQQQVSIYDPLGHAQRTAASAHREGSGGGGTSRGISGGAFGGISGDRGISGSGRSPVELLARLSRKERQVLNYLRSELTEREVAEHMQRSPHTVHVHVKNIYRKLNVSSRKQLLGLFIGSGGKQEVPSSKFRPRKVSS